MNVTKAVTIDLQNQTFPKVIPCKQYDANSRYVAMTLMSGKVPFVMPEHPTFMVACRKPKGGTVVYDSIINVVATFGLDVSVDGGAWSGTGLSSAVFTYDGGAWTLDGDAVNLADYGVTVDGTPENGNTISVTSSAACASAGNVVTVEIAQDCLMEPGKARLDVFVMDGGEQVGAWTLLLVIEESVADPGSALASVSLPVVSASIQAYVNAWLDAHPEATTTVEDGSLTPAKFAASCSITIEQIDSITGG